MAVTRHGENRYDAARRSRKQVPRPPDPGSPDPFTNAKEHGARNVDAPERSPSLAGEGAHQPPPRRNDPLMLPGIELDDDPLRFPRHRSPGERDPGNPFPWLELPGQEVEQRRFSRPPRAVEVHQEGTATRKVLVLQPPCGALLQRAHVTNSLGENTSQALPLKGIDRRRVVRVDRDRLLRYLGGHLRLPVLVPRLRQGQLGRRG